MRIRHTRDLHRRALSSGVSVFVFALLLTACGNESKANWDRGCDPTIAGSVEALDADRLAWLSDQIVVGTIVEVPAPYATRAPGDSSAPAPPIATLQVESRTRGKAAGTLLLHACQFDYPGWIFLQPGERMLVFLLEIRRVDDRPVYAFVGEHQGLWRISEDERVESPVTWSTNVPLADMLANVRTELLNGTDDRTARDTRFIPLDEAPLVDP